MAEEELKPFVYYDENPSEEMIGCEGDLSEKRMTYRASRTGSAFLMSYDDGVFFKCIRGPIGNGKSVLMCHYIVKKSQEQLTMEITEKGKKFKIKWSRWLIMRHTLKSIKETAILTWNQWYGDKTKWKQDPYEGRYEDWLPDGTLVRIDFIVLASESPNILNDLQSLELSGAWVNEAVQSPYAVVSKVFTRLKRFNPVPHSKIQLKTFQVIMDTNSPNETNWWRRKEECEKPKGWMFFVCPPAILEEIDPETGVMVYVPNDIEHAKKHGRRPAENVLEIDGGYHHGMSYWMDMLSALERDDIYRLLMNRFGLLMDGLGVFTDVYNPAVHRVSAADAVFQRGMPVVCGMDLGRTPAAAIGQMKLNGTLQIQREATCWNQRLNNNMGGLDRMDVVQFFDTKMLPILVNYYDYPNCNLTIFADPAGKNFSEAYSISAIERLRNERGVNIIPCDKVESLTSGEIDITNGNNTNIRISCVKSALRTRQLEISEACLMLCQGMAGKYCYPKEHTRDGDGSERYKESPDKNEWSHICDGAQYLCLAVFKGKIDYSRPIRREDPARYINLVGGGTLSGGYL